MATRKLGDVAVGEIVKLKENGVAVDYIVVHQGLPSDIYDTSCDGTWLLRKGIDVLDSWSSGSNKLEKSSLHSYLNNSWINKYDANTKNAIKQVKIPYRSGGGEYGTDCLVRFSCYLDVRLDGLPAFPQYYRQMVKN